MSKVTSERDRAFRDVLYNGDMRRLKAYSFRYGVTYPSTDTVAKAGVYKAIGELNTFTEKEKEMAAMKAEMLGFNPRLNFKTLKGGKNAGI